MKLILAAAAFAMLLLNPGSVLACTCGGVPKVCGSFEAAEAVVVGTVTRVENEVAKTDDGREYITRQTAYVQVDESFKGARSPEMIFRSFGTSCDAHYAAGQRWLFYAYHHKEDNTWFIRACDRTTQLESAADDLLYLRGLPQSAQKTRIAGQLRNRDNTPLVGVKVKLVRSFWMREVFTEFLPREVFTDKNGVYEIYGLPPGKYLVQPDTPVNLKVRFSGKSLTRNGRELRGEEVELTEKSCAVVNFYYTEDTLVSGRVFGAEGQPMRDVCVRLVYKDNPKDTPYLGTCTDENGRFKIEDVVLGEYVLVVNEDAAATSNGSFPPTYYPGVFDKEKAVLLIITSGDKFEDFNIHIPPQPKAPLDGRADVTPKAKAKERR